MTSEANDDKEKSYVRVYLEPRVIKANETTREVWFEVRPDPRRYDERQLDGKKVWVDKYTGDAFTEELWRETAPQLGGLPLSHLSRHIDDAVGYAAGRKQAFRAEIETGQYVPPSEVLTAHASLAI